MYKKRNIKDTQGHQLLQLFSDLCVEDKNTLLSFAEFLAEKNLTKDISNINESTSKVVKIQRPKKESVIKAIKRLSESYPMIEKDKLLHSISDLMTAHMMQGKSAELVIDELELLFLEEFQNINK